MLIYAEVKTIDGMIKTRHFKAESYRKEGGLRIEFLVGRKMVPFKFPSESRRDIEYNKLAGKAMHYFTVDAFWPEPPAGYTEVLQRFDLSYLKRAAKLATTLSGVKIHQLDAFSYFTNSDISKLLEGNKSNLCTHYIIRRWAQCLAIPKLVLKAGINPLIFYTYITQ